MVCIGGSVFSQTHLSGVATASKDIDYPFVSMQSASAAAQLSALMDATGGAATQLQSAATTPLTELREHPVVLLGGYNNQWTLRLLQPLRFHFAPVTAEEAIVDSEHPESALGAGSIVALLQRGRLCAGGEVPGYDHEWMGVVLAGIGRNGTEAAAQFATSSALHATAARQGREATSPTAMSRLCLKVNVIDGKTGAPSILEWHVW